MGRPSRIPTVVAWIVVALVVAWAPVFHAICVAPAEAAAATHVMADGTVMTTGAAASDAGDAGHAGHAEDSAGDVTATAGPATTLLDAAEAVGVIVVFVGMAVLSLAMFVRRCRRLPARGDPPRRRWASPSWRDIRAWRPIDVDLQRLGISRT